MSTAGAPAPNLDWKSLEVLRADGERNVISPGYHALRAIAGPATANPVWAMDWTAPDGHTYKQGDPAPRWTAEEIYWAMKPQLRSWARGADRRSGSGLHGARANPSVVNDAEQSMALALMEILEQEVDEGRILAGGGFVSYVTRRVKEAALTGVGGTTALRNALGRVGDLLRTTDPQVALQIAAQIGEEYRTTASRVVDPENPFGPFSPAIFQAATGLGHALQTGDPQALAAARAALLVLDDGKGQWGGGLIKDAMELVQGVDTGRRDIGTPHWAKQDSAAKAALERFYQMPINSMSTPAGPEADMSLGDTIAEEGGTNFDLQDTDKEIIGKALQLGRGSLRSLDKPKEHPRLQRQGLKPLGDGDFRYLIRLLAPWLLHGGYPGKGNPTGMVNGILTPYRDPEIDPRTGATSEWVRRGQRLRDAHWSPHRLEIINDIVTGGPQQYGMAGSVDLTSILGGARLTPTELEILELLVGVNASYPHPLGPAQIVQVRNIARSRVNTILKVIARKTGETIADIREQARRLKAAATIPTTHLQISPDPTAVFMAWVREYARLEGLERHEVGIVTRIRKIYSRAAHRPGDD